MLIGFGDGDGERRLRPRVGPLAECRHGPTSAIESLDPLVAHRPVNWHDLPLSNLGDELVKRVDRELLSSILEVVRYDSVLNELVEDFARRRRLPATFQSDQFAAHGPESREVGLPLSPCLRCGLFRLRLDLGVSSATLSLPVPLDLSVARLLLSLQLDPLSELLGFDDGRPSQLGQLYEVGHGPDVARPLSEAPGHFPDPPCLDAVSLGYSLNRPGHLGETLDELGAEPEGV